MDEPNYTPQRPEETQQPGFGSRLQDINGAHGSALVQYVQELFTTFAYSRKPYDEIARECWYNFRGQYQKERRWTSSEAEDGRSKVFVKLTQQKCHTAQAKVMEAYGENIQFDMEPIPDVRYPIPPEVLTELIEQRKNILSHKLMEAGFFHEFDIATLNAAIFGMFIMKGPILERNRKFELQPRQIMGMPANQLDPNLEPYEAVPVYEDRIALEHVPFWEYFTDPNARCGSAAIGEIHFRRILPQEMRSLASHPGFIPEACFRAAELATISDAYIDRDRKYIQLGEDYLGYTGKKDSRVSYVEFHGLVPVKMLRALNRYVPDGLGDDEDVEACVVLGSFGILLKAEINLLGTRLIHSGPWRALPDVCYGTGVASLIRDMQMIVNSSIRMIIDNKKLSGCGMVGVNYNKINRRMTRDMSFKPGKVWYGDGDPNEWIKYVGIPDTTAGLRELFELGLRIADEESGIPKYTEGSANSSFLNKTATGMSMIMGQANVNLKPVMRNADAYIFTPIITAVDNLLCALGQYPAQVAQMPLKIVAQGTLALMAKEIIVENAMKLLSLTQNPSDAAMINREDLIRNIASLLNLSKFVKSREQIAKIQQMISEQANKPQVKAQVDMDRMYPLLTRAEQEQILAAIGIKADFTGGQAITQKDRPQPAEAEPQTGAEMPMPEAGAEQLAPTETPIQP